LIEGVIGIGRPQLEDWNLDRESSQSLEAVAEFTGLLHSPGDKDATTGKGERSFESDCGFGQNVPIS